MERGTTFPEEIITSPKEASQPASSKLGRLFEFVIPQPLNLYIPLLISASNFDSLYKTLDV